MAGMDSDGMVMCASYKEPRIPKKENSTVTEKNVRQEIEGGELLGEDPHAREPDETDKIFSQLVVNFDEKVSLLQPIDPKIEWGTRLHLEQDKPFNSSLPVLDKLKSKSNRNIPAKVIEHLSINKDGELVFLNKFKV